MGKWEPTERQGYHDVYRMTEGKIDWLTNNTGFDKDQATRYALALNIVDAGVDLGEFKELLGEWSALETWFNDEDEVSRLVIPHDLYHNIKVLFTSIANAVEGDKTKEDV